MQIAELENERRVWFFTPKSAFPAYRSVRAGRGALHLPACRRQGRSEEHTSELQSLS